MIKKDGGGGVFIGYIGVVNHWSRTDYFDTGKDIDALYLDLQNAFDKVPISD